MDPRPAQMEIRAAVIDENGDNFFYSHVTINVPQYKGARPLDQLPVQLLTPDLPLYEELKQRGRKFVQLKGPHHMDFDGVLIRKIPGDDKILRIQVKVFASEC
jgi:hypothetical protein